MECQHQSKTKNAIASSNKKSDIARSSTHPIEELQGAIGNQAVNQLLANQPVLQAKPMFKGLSHELRSPSPLQAKPAKQADITSVSEVQPENKTGLPDRLKAGIENFSGLAMDDVRVHYNSSKPSQLQALAYTQGTDIHVAPGQEEHLPHEAWHVVQQKQGRVKPTIQAKDVRINDDEGLEKEADVLGVGAKAAQGEQVRVASLRQVNADTKLGKEADMLGEKVAQGEMFRGLSGELTRNLQQQSEVLPLAPVQCLRKKKPPKYTFSESEDTEEDEGALDNTIKHLAKEKDSTQSQEKPPQKPNLIKKFLNRIKGKSTSRMNLTESQPIPKPLDVIDLLRKSQVFANLSSKKVHNYKSQRSN